MKAYLHTAGEVAQTRPQSLVEVIVNAGAASKKNNHGIYFVQNDGSEVFKTYSEILETATQVLRGLRSMGLKKGDKVVFQLKSESCFVHLFWACILGGIVPVPLTVINSASSNSEALLKLIAVCEQLDAPLVFTETSLKDLFSEVQKENKLKVEYYESIPLGLATVDSFETPKPDELAYIQFSSGSTGSPKGVTLTHQNLVYNTLQFGERCGVTSEDFVANWMPLTHDLGIVGLHLQFVVYACNQFIISPTLFIKDPTLYLRKVTEHRATFLGAPNFALAWMEERVREAELASLDLSSIKTIIDGAEPISVDVNRKFFAKFSKSKIKETAIRCCYGMAEACVAISIPDVGEVQKSYKVDRKAFSKSNTIVEIEAGNDDYIEFVELGYPVTGMEIKIIDELDNVLDEGQVGNIVIKGPNVTSGYFNNPKANEELFADGFLRTGDLGFVKNGRLVITGRKKDIIFFNGQNFYAHDMERICEEIEGVETGRAVACGVTNHRTGREELVIFLQYRKTTEEFIDVEEEIKKHINMRIGNPVTHVIPIKSIPKTTSGKIQRFKLGRQYLDGEFDAVIQEIKEATKRKSGEGKAADEIESRLLEIWQRVLNANDIDVVTSYFVFGVSSIELLKISGIIKSELGVNIDLGVLFECQNIRNLAALVKNAEAGASETTYPDVSFDPSGQSLEFPLTDLQTAYFLGRESDYELGGVSTHAYVEMKTGLDISRLNKALHKVIERHGMLRAIFSENHQCILQNVPDYWIEVEDVSGLGEAEIEARLFSERERMSHHIFKTDQWPLFEFKALKCPEGRSYLLFGFDMLIIDAGSLQIVFEDLMKFYDREALGPDKIPFSYRDYVLAYTKFKDSDVYRRDKNFWMGKLESFPSAPRLPTLVDTFFIEKPLFKRFQKRIDRKTWEKLKQTVAGRGITPSATLCAIYLDVLAFWSNQPQLAINLTFMNRYPFNANVDKLVGDFTSVIPLGVDLATDATFWERAKTVQRTILDGVEHRHYDGVEFIRELTNAKGSGARTLIPVVFTSMLTNDALGALNKLGEVTYSISQTSQVYLDFQASEVEDSLFVNWDYLSNVLSDDMVDEMFQQFVGALISLVESTEAQEIELPESFSQMVDRYNATSEDIAPGLLHRQFEEHALKNPDHIAIVEGSRKITYGELHRKSNQVAKKLKESGVKGNDLVGVLAARCLESIVNILGILKAGGAYVPIDPQYPQERVDYILSHSRCSLMLTPDFCANSELEGVSPENVFSEVTPENIAYVIYTSGSTGKPKGVVITHGAALNTIIDINQKFRVGSTDKILGISSMCFDLSVYDIFGALIAGATLVQVPDQREVIHLYDVIQKERITIWNSVPAIMDIMLDNVTTSSLNDSVRLVLLSGDWIPLNLPEKMRRHFVEPELISLGGATEASIWSIYYPIQNIDPRWKSIPYGMPLANQSYFVLDYKSRKCPPNVEGELFIGGVGVAKEYYLDAEKTSESMRIHSQFGRLYKTGDYGAYRVSDSGDLYIEFLGRKDSQVKISGHRIELTEIEKNLLTYQGIDSCVVIDKMDSAKNKFLCAYFVSNHEIDSQKLKDHLGDYLPEYMVPGYFVKIESIPLTPNGKVDRKALPEIATSAPVTKHRVAPRNDIEKALCALCCEVLGTDEIGIFDSLFEYHLDSIKTVTIISKIEKKLQTRIAFRDFARRNNIAEIAQLVLPKPDKKSAEPMPTIRHDSATAYEAFPTTEIQKAYILGRETQFEISGISAHFYGEIEGRFNIEKLNRSIRAVIDRHPMLRTIFDHKQRQRILEKVPDYEIEVLDLRRTENRDQMLLLERNRMSHQIFPVDQWPLFELKVARMDDRHDRLMIGYDLLISDGASALILGNEITEFYRTGAFSKNLLDCTFKDYLLEYQNFRSSELYRESKEYWLNKLGDFPSAPQLPFKVNPSAIEKPHFVRLRHKIDKVLWESVKRLAQKSNVTASAVLCAVYAKVMSEWSNQERLAINMTVFNRYPFHERINDMVGDFTSTVLVDVNVGASASFWELATATQGTIMEALEHRHFDGVEFTRELLKYNSYSATAGMPIVFTSMLQGGNEKDRFSFGLFSYSVSQTPQVYIDYQVSETKEGLVLTWDYVAELFDEEMIQTMFAEYSTTIESLGKGGEIKRSALLNREKELIDNYNRTEEKIKPDLLHRLVVEQAEKTGDYIAVIDGDHKMTYRELNERSNQIARKLVELGVRGDNLVGVSAVRCKESIVNILGILKAGGAYVPIDPQYPKERVDYILSHSRCSLLLEPEFFEKNQLQDYSRENLTVNVGPENLAYVIYTSGSTGKPKGVVITHEAAVNTVVDINRKFQVTHEDRILGISSMCFDLSVYDIFGALISGAALVQIPDQRDVKNLSHVLQKEGVTIWNSVPTIMDMMLQNTEGSVSYQETVGPVYNEEDESFSEKYWRDNQRYFWSPAISWDRERGLEDHMHLSEELLALFPEFFFYTEKGCRLEDLYKKFAKVPEGKLKSFVSELIEKRILVSAINSPHEVFRSQEKLFDNPYNEDIIFNAESYEAFKKKQLGRRVKVAGGEKKFLVKKNQFPDFVEGRYTHRKFHQKTKIPFSLFSQLISVFMQRSVDNHIQYYYPSAGGLYPIDVFIYIKEGRIEDFDKGLYYYSPIDNSLTLVNGQCTITADSQYYTNREIFDSSAATLYFVYNAEATMPKYGGAGYLYACIDTGLMLGLLVQIGETLNIGTCSIGEMNFEEIRGFFNLNRNQVLIHSLELGLKENAVLNHVDQEEMTPGQSETIPTWKDVLEADVATTKSLVTAHRESEVLPIMSQTKLRLVMLSGDWIPLGLPGKVKKHFSGAEVVSLGGATEASIWSIYYPIHEENPQWKSIPYGIPLANQKFFVLDYRGDLCHVGVAGELYIGGVGVAKGYYDDFEKTDRAFIEHPLLGRIYKTGDYGKLHSDGLIEFLGRKDQQVKIKGHRIELGEIENCLAKFPGVINAVVVDYVDQGGKKYLCAYYVSDTKVDTNAIREHILNELPAYMLPSYFMQITSIPLSSNAKVDRKQLPKPDVSGATNLEKSVPRNELEKTILDVWKTILQSDEIGVKDNFFEVGGDSVLLVNVHTKLDQMYPDMLKITDLFTCTSVSAIAEFLRRKIQLSTKKVVVQGVSLPSDYFAERGLPENSATLSFRLERAIASRLIHNAQKTEIGVDVLLASLYLYVIGQISGTNSASLQTMIGSKNSVSSVTVDFSQLTQFDQLFVEVSQKIKEESYSIDNIKSIEMKRDPSTFIAAFVKKGHSPNSVNLSEFYDHILFLDVSGNDIELICEYNGAKLKPAKAKALFSDYVQLLSAYLETDKSLSEGTVNA